MDAHKLWLDRLLFALALCLAGLVLYTGKSVTTSEVMSRENNLLSAWRRDDLSRISLLGDGEQVVLEQQTAPANGQRSWKLLKPLAAEADPQAVDDLLNTLKFAIWLRKLEPSPTDPKTLGLAKPRRSLKLDMGSLSYEIELGKQAPSPEGASYVRVTGPATDQQAVGVVKQQVVQALLVDSRAFMGRSFVHAKRSEVMRVSLDGARGKRSFVRTGHRFRFDGMLDNQLIDSQALDPFFFHLARLRAERYLEPNAAKSALRQGESVSLRLVTAGSESDAKQRTFALEVGGRCPTDQSMVVVLREKPLPLAGCTTADVMAGFTLASDSLIDRTPFSFRVDEVERVVAQIGSQRLELVRDSEGFALKAPVQTTVTLARGNQRIETIVSSPGQMLENPDLAALGLEPPRGSMTVTGLSEVTNSTVDERISLGSADAEGRLPIRREADQSVLLLNRTAAGAFRADATLSRSLKLVDFSEASLSRIHILTDRLEQKLERRPSGYELIEPEGFKHDAVLVNALTSALMGLSAERWVSDQDDTDFGLKQPTLRVDLTIESEAGPKETSLRVGHRIPGGAYASASHLPGVFILSSATLRSVSTPVLSRADFVIEPHTYASITLQTPERRVVLQQQGGNFTSDTLGVGKEHAARIVEALENLRPEFAVRIGPPKPEAGFAQPMLSVRYADSSGRVESRTVSIGSAHVFQGMGGYFARTDKSNATFAISQGRVQQLLDLL